MPGSGKSKFLDVLITQLALAYSPDEIGFYLADLREGVTFQDYIHLPHVRVIALENEREFALNILRRMQDEIEPRSVAFKAVRGGIDNLSDYRRATGEAMPRLCMIIDEFQVLFAEDDKIASEAAKILEDIAASRTRLRDPPDPEFAVAKDHGAFQRSHLQPDRIADRFPL